MQRLFQGALCHCLLIGGQIVLTGLRARRIRIELKERRSYGRSGEIVAIPTEKLPDFTRGPI